MSATSKTTHSNGASLKPGQITLFAFSSGAIVANLYYAQPIAQLIASSLGMSGPSAAFIVSLTQIGYALGLFFIVPLGDLVENRKLMLITAFVAVASLAAMAMARTEAQILSLALLVGVSSVSVQILIPLAAHLAPENKRGHIVGLIMSGLLGGILLARPVSSTIAGHFGWRGVFTFAAVLMACVSVLIAVSIPPRRPGHTSTYKALIKSLLSLAITQPVLRHRAFYQGLMFASFSMFWTSVPVELRTHYGLSEGQIALFALVGALGAAAAPIAGKLADAGHSVRATFIALITAAVSYTPYLLHTGTGITGLIVTGIALDFAVQMSLVISQREIYSLGAQARGRLNAFFMTSIFVGGAAGSALAGSLYSQGGWHHIALVAGCLPIVALLHFFFVGTRDSNNRSHSEEAGSMRSNTKS